MSPALSGESTSQPRKSTFRGILEIVPDVAFLDEGLLRGWLYNS